MPTKNDILVIIESPGKIKLFRKYLSSNYDVIASVGHVIDLPPKQFGVNIRKDFEPTWKTMPGKEDILKKIKDKASKSQLVIIMTDPDREGSGIGWHIYQHLNKNSIPIKRAITQSVTKQGISDAINNAYDIEEDSAIVESYECRRILDRICGYRTSYVTKQATGGSSAGRVQSATLRIIADREKEIIAFIPQEYWNVEAELLTPRDEKVVARIKKPKPLDIKNQKQAEGIRDELKAGPVKVSKFEEKKQRTGAYAPFTTSTMLQAASSIHGWKADKTMKMAQSLYEAGHITYHRTDSVKVVPAFVTDVRDHIKVAYGQPYLPQSPNQFASKKQSQEAHEACRVTDLKLTKVNDVDPNKLYKMVWKRTVASQMEKVEQQVASAEFACKDNVLSASGSKVLFDGWRKVWDYSALTDTTLPDMTVGEMMKVIDVKIEQKFTEPPPRYTSNSIIKKMEENGIGRPSTYASTIKTLESRKYIEHQKKSLLATDLGIKVSDFLIASDFCFIDIGFTADLEEKLDKIADKSADRTQTLREFWDRLKKDIERAKDTKNQLSKTSFTCPDCSSALLLKHGRFGSFFSCEKYSKKGGCSYTANVGEDGKPVAKVKKSVKESAILCQNCKQPLMIREGKKGEFLGCRNFAKDEKCKGFFDINTGEKIKFKKKFNKNKG